jgi:hypothetical protein
MLVIFERTLRDNYACYVGNHITFETSHFKCGCNSELNNTYFNQSPIIPSIYLQDLSSYLPIYLPTYLIDQSFQQTANGSAL